MNHGEGLKELTVTMQPTATSSRSASASGPRSRVVELLPESDTGLVAAILAGRSEARKALVDRYASEVERVLYRVLGPDPEIPDLLQDVFLAAIASLHTLRDPAALRGWLIGITVRKGRKCILRRRRWRFIQPFAPADLPEREASVPPFEVSEALRCTYAVLDRMNADERVVFSLRFVDGMELTAVAAACGVSLSTIKRRVQRAQRSFVALAKGYPALAEWIDRVEVAP